MNRRGLLATVAGVAGSLAGTGVASAGARPSPPTVFPVAGQRVPEGAVRHRFGWRTTPDDRASLRRVLDASTVEAFVDGERVHGDWRIERTDGSVVAWWEHDARVAPGEHAFEMVVRFAEPVETRSDAPGPDRWAGTHRFDGRYEVERR